MADIRRLIQDYNSSGEATELKIGGTAEGNKAATLNDLITAKAGLNMLSPMPPPFSVNDTTATVIPFNNVTLERGHINASVLDKSITVYETKSYELNITINVEFLANRQLDIYLFVNGVDSGFEHLSAQGLGSGKPVNASIFGDLKLNSGDVVDFRLMSEGVSFDITFLWASFSIKEDR